MALIQACDVCSEVVTKEGTYVEVVVWSPSSHSQLPWRTSRLYCKDCFDRIFGEDKLHMIEHNLDLTIEGEDNEA